MGGREGKEISIRSPWRWPQAGWSPPLADDRSQVLWTFGTWKWGLLPDLLENKFTLTLVALDRSPLLPTC